MQKTYKFLISLVFLFNLSSSFAQTPINTDTTHSINIAKSKIMFFAKQSSVEVSGEFKKISGNIKFDPNNLESSSVEVTIPIDSLYIGGFENEMMNEAWFHKAKFPNVYFSSSIVKNGNGYILNGKLKIKEVSSDVKIPVSLIKEDNITYFSGEFIIKRADFKVGTGEWADLNVVANDFKSNKFDFNGEKVTSIQGDLTFLGVTQPVTLTAKNYNCFLSPMLKKEVCGARHSESVLLIDKMLLFY